MSNDCEQEGGTETKRLRVDREEEKIGECKEKQVTKASSLSDDIILYIFNKISADLLWVNFISLSKQWSNLIFNPDFIYRNVRQSTGGIIFREDVGGAYAMKFMKFKATGVVQVHELHKSQTHFSIRSSSNGLLLLYINHYCCHVLNPITKQNFSLECPGYKFFDHILVFVPSTKNHKIVEFLENFSMTPHKEPLLLRVHDLHGSLKRIEVPPPYNLENTIYRRAAVAVDGVVYWDLVGKGIACFDVSTEAFRLLPYPIWCYLMIWLSSIEGFLSSAEYTDDKINIWILKDEKWAILYSIEINNQFLGRQECYPCELLGNLNNGALIVFRDASNRSICVYDTKAKQWTIIKNKSVHHYTSHIHVNSLFAL